ncbi:MAG: hypothetical protein N3B10_12925 [Armatimonadetes bacterium]|nr:hypothetical protein [Armatimonadota bacterium]MCX7969370.1 hypothetical protein [Armatimonadota bacterium]MDW8144191.1 hypothetical protein [Armatimonadota bacterium]
MKRLVGLSVLVVVAFALVGKAALQEREVTLRFKFPVNQVRTYEQQVSGEIAMTMRVLGEEAPFMISVQGKMTETERIESVDKEGVATLVTTVKGRIKTEVTGLPAGVEVPPEQDIPPVETRFKVTPLGKVLEVETKLPEKTEKEPSFPFPSDFAMPQMQGLTWQGLLFPENPVKVGDTWDISTKIDFKLEDRTVEIEIKGKARLVGFEKVDGRECAVIEATTEIPDFGELVRAVPIPEAKGKVRARTEGQANSKIWFDINEGLIARNETSVDMTMNFSFSLPTGQSISMSMQGTFKSEERLTKVSQGEAKK